jgi:hypothetical protein
MKASTALVALLAVDLVALAMVLGLAWQRSGRFDHLDTVLMLVFLALPALLLGGFAKAMDDQRPIVFFAVFFGLIFLPWLAAYTAFGPGMIEKKQKGPPVPAAAEGGYVQKLEFADEEAARKNLLEDLGGSRRQETAIAGRTGFLLSAERPMVFVSQEGRVLRMVQAQERAQLEQLLGSAAPAAVPGAAAPAADKFLDRIGVGPVLGGVLLYTLFVAWAFLRLAAWASVLLPPEGVAQVPAATLRERLLAVAKADVPFTVRVGEEPGTLVAEWRYADARWLDLARAHAMHKSIRYVMRLDEASHSVRVLEYRAEFSAGAGAGGAGLQYRVSRGITFFETQRETVLGLQIRDGALTPDLAYSWKFEIEEMRGPLARIANQAGWAWKPLMLDVPWLAG